MEILKKIGNGFISVIKGIGKGLYQIGFDFIDSFKVKPWKICTILFMIPAIFIGLFLGTHYDAIIGLNDNYAESGFILFLIIMLGCINIFNALGFSSKRNTFMAVFSTIIALCSIACAAWYTLVLINAKNSGTYSFLSATYLSLIIIWVSEVCGLAGSIVSYFYIDHERVREE